MPEEGNDMANAHRRRGIPSKDFGTFSECLEVVTIGRMNELERNASFYPKLAWHAFCSRKQNEIHRSVSQRPR